MDQPAPVQRLSRWERFGLGSLLVVAILFGAIVVIRGAFLHKRMTDLAVFLRAAWAVQSGADLYSITDDKDLPYNYPPLLAILLVPFGDPPAGVELRPLVPFAVKVGIWYLASVLVLALGIHALARALEQTAPTPADGRRWWGLRVLPFLVCVAPLGHALSLGQVNVLWVALLCAMAAASIRGRSFQAGGWLAGAICLKVLPVFLLLYPFWRRDLRCLAGCGLGLVVGLGVVPAVALGPERALAFNREWTEVMLLPAFGKGSDRTRDKDLLGVTATHNQSLMATWHKTLHLDRATRPEQVSAEVRRAHWLVGGALTGITLLAAGRRRHDSRLGRLLFLAALNVNMLLLSPAGHPHYLALLLPLVMGLLAAAWERRPEARLGVGLRLLLGLNVLAGALPLFPDMTFLYDVGLPMYAAILLWLAGVIALWKTPEDGTRLTFVPAQDFPLQASA